MATGPVADGRAAAQPGDGLEVRRAAPGDRAAILGLLAESLGWGEDARHGALFAWKHERNPFGPSPAWVAVDGDVVAGFRTFLRWEFELAGVTATAVRAVDTATAPAYRGRGIFTALTLRAVADLTADGVGFVFNTPNDQSRPGYLKMGWQDVGRLPIAAHVRSPSAAMRMSRARVAADLWSLPTEVGMPVAEALADEAALTGLLASQPPAPGLRTRRTPAFLRWRYGDLEPIAYRAFTAGRSPADGMVLFRLRRRGDAVEAVIGDVLAPDGDRGVERALLQGLARRAAADYLLRVGQPPSARTAFVPVPRQGPVLVWRRLATPLAAPPPLASWALGAGDVELF